MFDHIRVSEQLDGCVKYKLYHKIYVLSLKCVVFYCVDAAFRGFCTDTDCLIPSVRMKHPDENGYMS